jgi:predicted GIY-YIG superfamily endonuclease
MNAMPDCDTGESPQFVYVYILRSIIRPDHHYVGLTEDLNARLTAHNAGRVPYRSRFRHWVINTAIDFRDRDRATAFERYLKSTSGRAFARKRL